MDEYRNDLTDWRNRIRDSIPICNAKFTNSRKETRLAFACICNFSAFCPGNVDHAQSFGKISRNGRGNRAPCIFWNEASPYSAFPRFYGKLKHEFDDIGSYSIFHRANISKIRVDPATPSRPRRLVFHPYRRHTCFFSLPLFSSPERAKAPGEIRAFLRESAISQFLLYPRVSPVDAILPHTFVSSSF